MDEVINEFVVESRERLDRADQDLILLEKDPEDKATLRAIFRTLHTIKGTCGFLGFSELEGLAHAGESLLAHLRDGRLTLTPEMTSALLQLMDAGRRGLASIGQTGTEGIEHYTELTALLLRLSHAPQSPVAGVPPSRPAEVQVPAAPPPAAVPAPAPVTPSVPPAAAPLAPAQAATPAPPAVDGPEPATPPFASADALVAKAREAGADAVGPVEHGRGVVRGASQPARTTSALPDPSASSGTDAAPVTPPVAENTIRVGVSLLDRIMNLVGELVLVRNQALQSDERQEDPLFQRLNHITSELQELVAQTRMQPIASVWSKFPRMTRDLAIACRKQVQLTMEGYETELDRSLLEAIKAPLTHLLRNAIDHGIEPGEIRVARGKSEIGQVTMRAYQEEGQVAIEVSDDGGGVDVQGVIARAVQQGIVTRGESEALTDHEALNLVFMPGFSTAARVTSVSGRGVGMDVVKTSIENIGGKVEIESVLDHGTTMKFKIPLTLAIIPALIVRVGSERYAIPQAALLELVRLDAEVANQTIERVQGVPLYRLRGELLPLIYLDEQLRLYEPEPDSVRRVEGDALNIIVLQVDDRRFGLVVDDIRDTEEIVVKPLGRELRGLRVYAGATIMGDGRIGLILDVVGIAHRARVIVDHNELKTGAEPVVEKLAAAASEVEQLLVFSGPDDGRMAVPAVTVTRLETISPDEIERVGSQDMVQYRGQILPLVHLESLLLERRKKPRRSQQEVGNGAGLGDDGSLQVVVCEVDNTSLGIVVEQILDIVEDSKDVRREGGRRGVSATSVVDGRVTELLDLRYFRKMTGVAGEVREA